MSLKFVGPIKFWFCGWPGVVSVSGSVSTYQPGYPTQDQRTQARLIIFRHLSASVKHVSPVRTSDCKNFDMSHHWLCFQITRSPILLFFKHFSTRVEFSPLLRVSLCPESECIVVVDVWWLWGICKGCIHSAAYLSSELCCRATEGCFCISCKERNKVNIT